MMIPIIKDLRFNGFVAGAVYISRRHLRKNLFLIFPVITELLKTRKTIQILKPTHHWIFPISLHILKPPLKNLKTNLSAFSTWIYFARLMSNSSDLINSLNSWKIISLTEKLEIDYSHFLPLVKENNCEFSFDWC